MEFMMKSKETLTKIRESLQYRQVFREIIKTQIQTLIDQLAYTGEESVLLTACTSEDDVLDNVTVGSVLGLEFLKQHGVFCTFREFCVKTPMNIDEKLASSEATRPSSNESAYPLGKRKFSEVNGEDKEENSETENSSSILDTKRPRSLTPLLNVSGKDESSTVESNNSATFVPKGYSKCSVCNYMSKFKANVTRHERAVHRINLEGAPMVTVQYACAICDYKSTYRSNVMRHEKSIHKLSTAGELDIDDDSFIQRIPNEGVQSVMSEGNQLFLNQTGIHTDNVENQSYVSPYTDYNEHDAQIRKEPVQFDTEAQDQSYQTGDGTKNDCNKLYIQSAADDVSELGEDGEGCHICNHCHEIFKSLSELRNHIDNTHFTVGNFICEKCEQSFKTEFRLQIHMATHNASKQEVCGCGKAFQYRTSLIRHERKCEYLKASQGSSKQGSECVDSNFESSFHLKEKTYTQNIGSVDTDKTT